ncbi:MAG: hypothetical protein II983_03060 [Firmicutes bacterium]|nr:hypothetical protein [Bacillota bacterium]MBQ4504628.1 hypothetical protein [Bacillota bacterium]MBQ6686524.1 hypothetical protein [Bacillota bacterium]
MEHADRAEFTEVVENEKREISFQIMEHIGVLSETKGWKKELNIVSWNNGPARFEIREWDDFHDYMRKGLAFTKGELKELRDILNDMDFSKIEIPETKARKRREDSISPLTGSETKTKEPLVAAQEQCAAAGTGSEESVPF